MGFIFLLIESALGDILSVALIKFDGLLPLIVWYSLHSSFISGFIYIFIIGILVSIFSTTFSYLLAVILAFFIVKFISVNININMIYEKMLLVGFVSIISMIIIMSLSNYPEVFWPWGVYQAIVNALFTPLFFFFFDRFITITDK
jgi:hypothetical protein